MTETLREKMSDTVKPEWVMHGRDLLMLCDLIDKQRQRGDELLGRLNSMHETLNKTQDRNVVLEAERDDIEGKLKDAFVAGCRSILAWTHSGMPQDDLDEAGYDYVASVCPTATPKTKPAPILPPEGTLEWLNGADEKGQLPHAPSREIEIFCMDKRLVRWLLTKARYQITATPDAIRIALATEWTGGKGDTT